MTTKEKILTVALDLFSENGYEGTSLQMIANEIGITKAAFYRHYKNKNDILDHIIGQMHEHDDLWMEENGLPSEFPDADTPDQMKRLNEFMIRRFLYWTEDEYASPFRRMVTIEQYHNSECAELFRSFILSGPLGWLEDIFREMMALDLMRPSDPAQAALTYWALFCYYLQLKDSGESTVSICTQNLSLALESFVKNTALG